MPRSVWSGSISFGLVNIPVKLVTAVKDASIRFHQLHGKDGARIRMKRFCSKEDKEVPYEEIVKGYELGPGKHVVVAPKELEALDPQKSRTIDIVDFVPLGDIDPNYFDHPYYLVPDKGAAKAYGLLLTSMKKSKRTAIARFVMREREYLAAIRAAPEILLLHTMRFDEELVPASAALGEAEIVTRVGEREASMAHRLVETLSTDFDPGKYHDEYRKKVKKLIEEKEEGKAVVISPEPGAAVTREKDLLAALEESVQEAKRRVGTEA